MGKSILTGDSEVCTVRGLGIVMGGNSRVPARSAAATLVALLLALSISSLTHAQDPMEFEGPGIDWDLPDSHMLYLKGTVNDPFLDRNWSTNTGEPLGKAEFTRTSSSLNPNLIDIESAPLSNSFRFEGNLSVRLFASLDSTNDGCRLSNVLPGAAGAETRFFVTLMLGNTIVLDNAVTNSIAMQESYLEAHEFTVNAGDVNVSMAEGDMISLSVDVEHDCIQQGILWWGTYDATSAIIFQGDVIEPMLDYQVDSNRMVRIEFTPISPWGPGDFDRQVIQIVGPLDWDEMVHGHGKEDQRLEHFEMPHGTRKGEANRTILTWTSEKPILPGQYMIDSCFALTDQDPGEACDAIAVLRFEILPDEDPLLSSIWAILIIPLAIVGWIGASIREATLPLPAYGVLLLLAIASIGPAMHLPDIDSEVPRQEGAAPSFTLLSHDGGLYSLSDLIEDSDALVVGLFHPGSPNSIRQMNEFRGAEALSQADIAFVQIATGEGVQAIDLDTYAMQLNESWPLLLDESDASTGKAFPSGATDAVIVIDSAGFVTSWNPGTMSAMEIEEAVESATRGSGNNPLTILGLVMGTALLPLLILAMPRDRKLKLPEEPLFPGAASIMTAVSAAAGFTIWALPISLLSALGAGSIWLWVELVLAILLIYHGSSMLLRGKIMEVEIVSTRIYQMLPEDFREWRDESSFKEDAYLGLWLAWLIWLRIPDLIPQGVGALARSDIVGAILSLFAFVGMLLVAGLVINLARLLALTPGNISRTFGWLSVGIRPRAWGLAAAVLGAWVAVHLAVGPIYGSM